MCVSMCLTVYMQRPEDNLWEFGCVLACVGSRSPDLGSKHLYVLSYVTQLHFSKVKTKIAYSQHSFLPQFNFIIPPLNA